MTTPARETLDEVVDFLRAEVGGEEALSLASRAESTIFDALDEADRELARYRAAARRMFDVMWKRNIKIPQDANAQEWVANELDRLRARVERLETMLAELHAEVCTIGPNASYIDSPLFDKVTEALEPADTAKKEPTI